MDIILAILGLAIFCWVALYINVLVGSGRRGSNRTPRWVRHQFPRSVVGRGPSRRAQKRALHLLRVGYSRLSSPGLGGPSVLLASSKALLRVVERGLAEAEAGAKALVSNDRRARGLMPERVMAMSEGRLAKQVNRLRGQVGEDVSSRLAKRTDRRRNRRHAHRDLAQMKRVKEFDRAVSRFEKAAKAPLPEDNWVETCNAIWRGSEHNPRNQRGRINSRCIEGTRAFERAGRVRSEDRLWVHKPEDDRGSLVARGEITPGPVERTADDAQIRQSLIDSGAIRPACFVERFESINCFGEPITVAFAEAI